MLAVAVLVAHASAFAPHQVPIPCLGSTPCVPALRPRPCARALAGGRAAWRTGEGTEIVGGGGRRRAGAAFGCGGIQMAAVKEASAEVVINAPLEDVWAVWSNFELMPRWQVLAAAACDRSCA